MPPLLTPCGGNGILTTIKQRFDRLATAAGLTRITFRDLRHSYATGALKAGINPKVVSEQICHANVGCLGEQLL